MTYFRDDIPRLLFSLKDECLKPKKHKNSFDRSRGGLTPQFPMEGEEVFVDLST